MRSVPELLRIPNSALRTSLVRSCRGEAFFLSSAPTRIALRGERTLSMRILGSIAVCLALAAGCATTPWYRQGAARPAPSATDSAEETAAASVESSEQASAKQTRDEKALTDAIAELEEFGPLDPQFKRELIADLRKTPPELWEPTVRVYRSALAYRRQLAARAAEEKKEAPAAPVDESVIAARDDSVPALPGGARAGRIDESSRVAQVVVEDNPSRPTSEPAAPTQKVPVRAAAPEPASAAVMNALAAVERETSDAAVTPASFTGEPRAPEVKELTWEGHLDRAIAGLQAAAGDETHDPDELRRQVNLRLLYLAAGRREKALRPIPGLSAARHDFWSKQLYALATYLDHEQIADPADRAAAALQYLHEAAAQLAEMGTLRVKNLAFCSEVKSYGVYTKFDRYEFAPDQQVLLYAEVENFRSEETEDGYVTELRSSYQILDSRGQRVETKEFPVTREVCHNRRRDFFMRYFINIPKRIYDGAYTLKLTIEDVKNQKFNQASIKFEVKGAN